MKKYLCKSPNKKICGVCAGIADYFNIDPTLVRLLAVLLAMISIGVGIIAYFISAIAIDEAPMNYDEIYQNTSRKLTKSINKKIFGVCGGIAEALDIQPSVIRLAWGFLTVFTVGIPGVFAYAVAAIIIPAAPQPENTYYQPPNNGYGHDDHDGSQAQEK